MSTKIVVEQLRLIKVSLRIVFLLFPMFPKQKNFNDIFNR